MTTQTTPTPDALRTLLAGLLGRQISVSDAPSSTIQAAFVGRYVTSSDNALAAAIVCDASSAAALGAALTLVPAGAANDCAKTGQLSAMIADNLGEVLNIASRVFNDAGWPHLRYLDMVDASLVPGADGSVSLGVRNLGVLTVDVEGYGSGTITLLDLAAP